MDLGTLIGIVVGNGLILSAMLMGGTMDMFIDYAGLMIVFGGAVSACLMAFPMKEVIAAFKAAMFCMTADKMEPNAMVQTMCDLCTVTRKSGLVALSKMKFDLKNILIGVTIGIVSTTSVFFLIGDVDIRTDFEFGENLSVFDKIIETDGLNAEQVLEIAKSTVREYF